MSQERELCEKFLAAGIGSLPRNPRFVRHDGPVSPWVSEQALIYLWVTACRETRAMARKPATSGTTWCTAGWRARRSAIGPSGRGRGTRELEMERVTELWRSRPPWYVWCGLQWEHVCLCGPGGHVFGRLEAFPGAHSTFFCSRRPT